MYSTAFPTISSLLTDNRYRVHASNVAAGRHRKDTIIKEEFLEKARVVRNFPAESVRKIGHPPRFPFELEYRLIQLYTIESEVVFGPFMGSGQTVQAALKSNRRFVGCQLNLEYQNLTIKRISPARS